VRLSQLVSELAMHCHFGDSAKALRVIDEIEARGVSVRKDQ